MMKRVLKTGTKAISMLVEKMHINILVMRYTVLYRYLFKLYTKLFKTTFQKDTTLQKYVKKPTLNFENN